ncbi:MAG: GDP-mannose 4,6-dehydratase [Verrucomicrobia bacterium]|nr:MAG: GDP-mannose 4,6-dehydratase [Verrucomicrobiota bacterium]
MSRVAITGIAGQDGTYLARLLLREGCEISGLLQFPFDREEPALRRRFSPKEFKAVHWHSGSLEDPFSLVRFLKAARPAEIYHLAGLTDSRQSFLVPEESVLAITMGTLRLLEAAREICPDARIFLASSSEVFGAPSEAPQDENTPRLPVSPYGIAKVAADHFARLHREQYGQFVSVGILYNHESSLRPPNYLTNRVARAVAAIKQGRANELELGDLSAERDWSDARDFVRGFRLCLRAKAPGDFVFASGVSRRVEELVACAFKAADLDYRKYVRKRSEDHETTRQRDHRTTRPQDYRASRPASLCGNPKKAKTELGWKPAWTFDQTIADLVNAELEDRPDLERSDPAPKHRAA